MTLERLFDMGLVKGNTEIYIRDEEIKEPKPGGCPGRDTMATCRLKMASRKTSEECCGNMAASAGRQRLHRRSTGFSAF